MKNKMFKMLVVGSMAILFGSSSISAFAGATTEKRSKKSGVAAKHPKTVRISVTKDRFTPSQIRAEKGYELTLIFNRADSKGCSKDVVFSSLNIRRKLEFKKDVTIVITPQEVGDIVFKCSNGTAKGTITIH